MKVTIKNLFRMVVVAMLLSVAACGGGGDNPPETPKAVWNDTTWDNMTWQ